MNIFALHENSTIAAQMHCDKHVVKMIVEHSQILCTALELNGVDKQYLPYRPCFHHHPSTKWAAYSLENYLWTLHCTMALCDEYTYRYGKEHKTRQVVVTCAELVKSVTFQNTGRTEFARAIKKDVYPQLLDTDLYPTSVQAYRAYYLIDKQRFARWTRRSAPDWWTEGVEAHAML